MDDGSVVNDKLMSGRSATEDQVMEVEIKQEVLIWDEVKEEVENGWANKDEEQEDCSTAESLCDEREVLQGSVGVGRPSVLKPIF
ncbi:hypothetical protein GE061_006007 [Apolygus lucorum]|uniref:Uncharacterized protein n=1 Tax=Apolygus lucorum TaxID=248454 RepID=A0A8S9WU31_APOLU|nr:hypothetical protein GE061_006007 [Apolygus lucorum]